MMGGMGSPFGLGGFERPQRTPLWTRVVSAWLVGAVIGGFFALIVSVILA